MLSSLAIICATLLGPVFAVQVQKYLERGREESERRNRIFKILMSTRATRLAPAHIEALNLIDIEFPATHKSFRRVRSAWKAYRTHLNEPLPDVAQQPVFLARRDDLFIDLLYEMGTALDYEFDKTQISKDAYSTVFHHNLESDFATIRAKILEILTGKAALPMAVTQFPADPEAVASQTEYLKVLAEHLRQGKPWPVTIVGGDSNAAKIVQMRPADTHPEGKTG